MATRHDMLKKLKTSGLTGEDAKVLAFNYLSAAQTKNLTEKELSSFRIPYFNLDGTKSSFWRLRYLEQIKKASFGKQKSIRYTQPPNALPQFYLPPILPQPWTEVAKDPEFDIIMTEGELKAACACKHGYATIGLGGVWSWKSKKRNKPLIADFFDFVWDGRNVFLIFDSDLITNLDVQKALRALALALTELGAVVYIGYLPQDVDGFDGKVGLDDFIVACGADELELVLENADSFELGQELWRLNTEVAYIKNPGFMVVQDTGQIITPNDFVKHAYSNRFYYDHQGEKTVRKPAAKAWLEWLNRFELESISYEPGGSAVTSDMRYNAWKGWGCEPKKGSVKPWKDCMAHVFKHDSESLDWFEKWCAYQFQYPGKKLATAVLFWGVLQGTGKSMIGFTLGKIFGRNYSEIGNAELHGNWNGWSLYKQFVFIDEIASADKRDRWQDSDLLKKLITQKEIWASEKHIKNYFIPDCVNYYMTSNNPDAIRMENSDRRFFIKEFVSKMPQAFYDSYWKWLEGEGAAHLFYYFLDLDLSDFNPNGPAPITADKTEMMAMARTSIASWIHAIKEDSEAVLKVGDMEVSELWTAQQLLELYDNDNEGKGFMSVNGMSRELKKAGILKLPSTYKINGKQLTLYAVKRPDFWLKAKRTQVANEYRKFFGMPEQRQNTREKKSKF